MGNDIIDFGFSNLYKCWRLFRKGKTVSQELIEFEYFLEDNLRRLQADLIIGNYRHGDYRRFEVIDNKRRTIKVAPIRDRVVHRLVYEYLKRIFDQTFIYDAWSCRVGKGLIGAINRTQEFLRCRPASYIWRADVKKFFDSVDRNILLGIIEKKAKDSRVEAVIKEIIFCEWARREQNNKDCRGIPIGNLTSQIFANIYLNELDRLAKHSLGIKHYLRYGDDFIILADNKHFLEKIRMAVKEFLADELRLEVNSRHDIIIKSGDGLKFLGVIIYPGGRRLNRRNRRRLTRRLNISNLSSYRSLIWQHEPDRLAEFNHLVFGLFDNL